MRSKPIRAGRIDSAAAWAGVLLASVCVAYGQTAPPTGSISGTVQNSAGAPVASVTIWINVRPTAPGAPFTRFNTMVTTAADGTFTASAVPDGTYAVCAAPPDSSLLPPCLWGSEPRVTVANGQAVTVPTIQLQPSADLYVRVNDLNGHYAAAMGNVPGASLMLAVRAPAGNLIPIPTIASDSTGFDAHMPIPPGTTVGLVAFSSYFSLTDSTGAAISKTEGLQLPVLIPAGTAQYKTVINVN